MKKLAIIGASYLQLPLIEKAKEMGLQTHVFAWAAQDVGEKAADFFYPISIVEKEQIAEKCRSIGIDGICTIATDLGAVTVNYVASQLGLPGNSMDCTLLSTNKHQMRLRFAQRGDPSPGSIQVTGIQDLAGTVLHYPVIVKPVDRSGSRGITRLEDGRGLAEAIETARDQGFRKEALVEEFVTGQEYSVECISVDGHHHFLAMTQKFTTGAPHFIETGHLQPAPISGARLEKIKAIVFHALDSLEIRSGASHTELKIRPDGTVGLIEIGGRMGGDCIGSDLVFLSTGVDFVRAVVEIALGQQPDLTPGHGPRAAGVRFIFTEKDLEVLDRLKKEHPQYLIREDIRPIGREAVVDSGSRFGYFLMAADSREALLPYLPQEDVQ